MKISRFIKYLFLLLPSLVSGQQYGFRNFSLEDGLPQTEVQALLQDSKGFLWAGTNGGGLVRFNGKSFRVFSNRDGLPDNIVYSLCEDREGNIWTGSLKVISKYDGESFHTLSEENIPGFVAYNQVFADNNNRIWAVSFDEQDFLRLVTITDDEIICVSDQFSEIAGNMLNVFFCPQG
ncbi:MAG: hypothetical protein KAT15_22165, partial [Bacteroidales bacterium]|nr:hypothetical protein [Bacteroidales bacterium]